MKILEEEKFRELIYRYEYYEILLEQIRIYADIKDIVRILTIVTNEYV